MTVPPISLNVGTSQGVSASSVTTTSGASRVGGAGSDQRMQAALSAAAQLFGTTTTQLQSDLASGQSLSTIANSKSIGQQQLQSTLQQAISSVTPQGSQPLSATLVAKIASRIAQHTGSVHGSAHHHSRPDAAAASTPTNSAGSVSSGQVTSSGSTFDTFA
jgi:hypothetical protein